MKRFDVFILAFFLTLSFHYGRSIMGRPIPYDKWYKMVVKDCEPGTTIINYDYRNCICLRPGSLSCKGPMKPGFQQPGSLSTKSNWDGRGCKKKTGRWTANDGCNWCYCDKGSAFCTNMNCQKNKKKLVTDADTCKRKPQGRFKANDGCNYCYCIDFNTPICTQMQCLHRQTMKLPRKLRPNACNSPNRAPGRWLSDDGCNWCFCLGPEEMCTRMRCPENMKRPASSKKKLDGELTYGFPDYFFGTFGEDEDNFAKDYKYYNNNEHSGNNKLSSIMLKKALKGKTMKEMAQSCKQGSKFKEPFGCNWCDCIEDGVVICETKDCAAEDN